MLRRRDVIADARFSLTVDCHFRFGNIAGRSIGIGATNVNSVLD